MTTHLGTGIPVPISSHKSRWGISVVLILDLEITYFRINMEILEGLSIAEEIIMYQPKNSLCRKIGCLLRQKDYQKRSTSGHAPKIIGNLWWVEIWLYLNTRLCKIHAFNSNTVVFTQQILLGYWIPPFLGLWSVLNHKRTKRPEFTWHCKPRRNKTWLKLNKITMWQQDCNWTG